MRIMIQAETTSVSNWKVIRVTAKLDGEATFMVFKELNDESFTIKVIKKKCVVETSPYTMRDFKTTFFKNTENRQKIRKILDLNIYSVFSVLIRFNMFMLFKKILKLDENE